MDIMVALLAMGVMGFQLNKKQQAGSVNIQE